VLAEKPSERFVDALRARGVSPISVGRVIVATWEPHENIVLETIRDMGLELQVIFNKGAVMILPPGVNKASGLASALDALNLSPHNAVAIGDAENDHAFLNFCQCGVAVSNALPGLMASADFVTHGDHGDGVIELIDELLTNDLSSRGQRLERHRLILGTDEATQDVSLRMYGSRTLIVGTSGSGKSTVATGLLERLTERGYTYCVIDPEGDYDALEGAVTIGTPDRAPTQEEVLQLIAKLHTNAVVNLIGLPFAERPIFFQSLLPHIRELRARTGRPHWLVVDETHHVLPAESQPIDETTPEKLGTVLMISVHPRMIERSVLKGVDTVIAVGTEPESMLQEFAEALGETLTPIDPITLASGEVLIWPRAEGLSPLRVQVKPSQTERRRHLRKYSEGELPEDRSFYFRGPHGKLNLRAQNLILFLQLGDGVDDETWLYHLKRGDISWWIENMIKDPPLAEEIRGIEQKLGLRPDASRAAIREMIERKYTLPATPVARAASA
jgi:hypothetical protein